MSELALLGGKKTVTMQAPEELFKWPIVTKEDEDAVLEVLRAGTMSGTDVTQKFEREFADCSAPNAGRWMPICPEKISTPH